MIEHEIFGDLAHLTINTDTKKDLVTFLKSLDGKTQRLLLGRNISILFLYLIIIIKIIKVDAEAHIAHPIYLKVVLASLYLFFMVFLWLHWRLRNYKPTLSSVIIKEYLSYKIHNYNREIRFLSGCLVTYLFIVLSSCIAFWSGPDYTLWILLTIIAPIGLIIFGAGLFLLLKQVSERKKLVNYIRVIDKSILNQFSKQ